MLAELAAILAPVFLCAGLGYAWGRGPHPFSLDFVTALVTNVATPCLIFSTLTKLQVSPAAFAEMVLAGLAALAGFAALGTTVLVVARQPLRAFLPALTFPNAGNLGLPLVLFAYGEAGLALAIAYFSVVSVGQFTFSVGQFTFGVWVASGAAGPRLLLRTPVLYALAAALGFMIAGTEPPRWLANTVELLGGAAIPLLLLSLGVALARLRVHSLPLGLALAVLRLGAGLMIGLAVAELFALEPLARGVLVLQSAMPAAVFNYLFAERYGNSPQQVAGVVLISTALSFATLPALLLLVL